MTTLIVTQAVRASSERLQSQNTPGPDDKRATLRATQVRAPEKPEHVHFPNFGFRTPSPKLSWHSAGPTLETRPFLASHNGWP